jgi:hypothetical protein
MKSAKTGAIIFVLAVILSMVMYVSINGRMESMAAVGTLEAAPSEQDRLMCERLIRFGQVAQDRGQVAEAKHFFQKAITVDPSSTVAWKKYNLALLALISTKVETEPGFLPDFSAGGGASDAPVQISTDAEETDDGC